MNKKQRKLIIRIAISFSIFLCALLLPTHNIFKSFLYIIAYFIVGIDIIKKAIKNIGHGQVFDENFLMVIATIGAFVTNEFPESVMVMLLYQVGEWFQSYATAKSRNSISELMNLHPDYANIEKDGKIIEVDPEEVDIDDLIIVKAGEKIPLDGIVIEGSGLIDTSSLTGESVPKKVDIGAQVFSGTINKSGLLTIKVTKKFEESTASKILELVENASNKKAKAENFITKFAKYYTPIVVIIALALAFFPPLFIKNASFLDYIHRACSFLVISCPCALVISVPLSFFGGIGGASSKGILIKGGNYLETLSKIQTIVFDKTGTLTKGTFEVTKIEPFDNEIISKSKLLEIAAHAENYSDHPIALSIKNAYGEKIDPSRISDVNEISGKGISAKIDKKQVLIGNSRLMATVNINCPTLNFIGTVIHIAVDSKYMGYILISDEIKSNSKKELNDLKKTNNLVLLTGDNKAVAGEVAKTLEIDEVYSDLLPIDKVQKVEELLKNKKVAFVGDGINDAPVLMRADVGIAMGGLGSDAAIEAADVVIMDDDVSKINTAINISKKTIRIVKQNIIFALFIKAAFLILGGFGITTMWEAVFADVGVTFIAILNSMRCLRN